MKKYMKTAIAMTVMFFTINVACAQQGPTKTGENEKKGPPKFAELLVKMDANKDGMLAKAEVKGPLLNDFDKIDLNKDGFLTEEEMKAAPKPQGPPPAKN